MTDAARQIEALLFALGRPLSHDEIKKHLNLGEAELSAALEELSARDGLSVVDDGRDVELRAPAAAASLIERVRKEEYARDIGKAGLEALCAVLYRGPLSRSDIDFIRGVNSSQTLRTLTMRGLVRRVEREEGRALPPGRRGSYLYEPTTELLSSLGVRRVQELPDYANVREKLSQLEEAYRASQAEPSPPQESV